MSKSDDDDDNLFGDDDIDEIKKIQMGNLSKNQKESDDDTRFFVENIQKNICNIDDYKYAYENQTRDQKAAIYLYIMEGQNINRYLRTEYSEKKSKKSIDNDNVRKIDENISSIKTRNACKNNSYYAVYRCMEQEYKGDKSFGYTSTNSNGILAGFGKHCIKIYIPINTPVLVGNSRDEKYKHLYATSLNSQQFNKNLSYEIMLPRDSLLIKTSIIEEELPVYYLQDKAHGGKGKYFRIKNVKSINTKRNKYKKILKNKKTIRNKNKKKLRNKKQ
jgi:hypothetical protein